MAASGRLAWRDDSVRGSRCALVLVIAAIVLAASGSTAAAGPRLHAPWTTTGDLVRALDGDTFDLKTRERGVIRIRLAGIDAPERGQAFSKNAKEHLDALLRQGIVEVQCYKDDGNEREVCRVFRSRIDLGLEMVRAGLAWHFKRYQGEQTEDERATYAGAEEEAKAAKKGLWSQEGAMAPWECRSAMREGTKCR